MTILGLVLRDWLLTVLTFPLIRLLDRLSISESDWEVETYLEPIL